MAIDSTERENKEHKNDSKHTKKLSLNLGHGVLRKFPSVLKPPSPKVKNPTDNPHVKSSDKLLSKLTYQEIENNTDVKMSPVRSHNIVLNQKDIISNNLTPEDLARMISDGHVFMLNPSWSSLIPIITLAVLTCLMLLAINIFVVFSSPLMPIQYILVVVVWAAAILHQKYNFKYYISSEGITLVKGLISMFVKRMRLPYDRIAEVEVRKPLMYRLLFLSVSDLYISAILFDDPELMLSGISNPTYHVTVIRLLMSIDKDTDGALGTPDASLEVPAQIAG